MLARVGLPLLRQLLPADFPRAHEIAVTVGWRALRRVGIALATVLIAGLPAAGSAIRSRAHQRVTAGPRLAPAADALVVGEIALAGLLCAGTLFLLRSYEQIGARDHGFDPAGALTFRLTVPRGARQRRPGHVGRR